MIGLKLEVEEGCFLNEKEINRIIDDVRVLLQNLRKKQEHIEKSIKYLDEYQDLLIHLLVRKD
jgi:hypothetical protein